MSKIKTKDNGHKTKVGDDKDGNTLPSGPRKQRRLCPDGQKGADASKIMLDATENRCNRKNSPRPYLVFISCFRRSERRCSLVTGSSMLFKTKVILPTQLFSAFYFPPQIFLLDFYNLASNFDL